MSATLRQRVPAPLDASALWRAVQREARAAMRLWAMQWRAKPQVTEFLRWAKFERERYFRACYLEAKERRAGQ